MKVGFFCVLIFIFCFSSPALISQSLDSSLWLPKAYSSERISSYDLSGGNNDFIVIPKGTKKILADIKGAGVIKHIWITLNSKDLMVRRNAVLRMYWDGSETPSVEVPLGDFFGQGWGEEYTLNSALLVAAPKKGKALNSYIPMPFGTQAKIEIENEGDIEIANFYYYIDYEKWSVPPPSPLRFFAWWNRTITEPNTISKRENEWELLGEAERAPQTIKDQYRILDVKGKGHFIGLNLYVDSPSPIWYGEGDDQIFIDSEKWPPKLHGTGTEDLFNTAWCPKEVFMHPYFGYPRVNDNFGWLGRTHLYRYWLESPLVFEKSFHFLLEHGHANALTLDLVSVAYFYKTLDGSKLPELPKKEFRQNQLEINYRHVHKWRDAYRSEKGRVWGNE
jgi:hypothetical protein